MSYCLCYRQFCESDLVVFNTAAVMMTLEYVWLSPLLPLVFGALASATTWITATLAWSWRLNLDSQMLLCLCYRQYCETDLVSCYALRQRLL